MPSILNATTTSGLVTSADNSGSLQLQTNNGTTAVTINTSQNVGIGTSSPSEKLSVTGNVTATGTNTSATYFHRSIAPATESNIETSLITTGNSANQRAGLFATNDYNNTLATELIFKTNATTGGATERMRIDASGRVTKPYQPYFAAHATSGSGAYTSVASADPFPANSTAFNVGSHYNTSNYRFTAPVTGNYLFTFSGINGSQSSGSRPMFYVNGSSNYTNGLQFGISGGDNGSPQNCTSAVIKLNAGDYVDVRSQAGNLYYYSGSHSCFTGILLS